MLADVNVETGQITPGNIVGSEVLYVRVYEGQEPLSYTILNYETDMGTDGLEYTLSILPPAPTFSPESVDEPYSESVDVSISSSYQSEQGDVSILYYLGEDSSVNPLSYSEPLTFTETTTITAWVSFYNPQLEQSYESEKVTKTYIVKKTPNIRFIDPTAATQVIVAKEAYATYGEADIVLPHLSNPYKLEGITYSSSNTNVATIDASTGDIEIVGAGNTTISASYPGNDDFFNDEASYVLVVSKADVELSFEQEAYSATLEEGFDAPSVTAFPEELDVTYSSSNTDVATVDASTGDITLLAEGQTTITASFAGDGNYNEGSASYLLSVASTPYPLVVGGVGVTEANRTSLFDGSVAYVPEINQLILKNTKLSGSIEVSEGIDQLNIYLIGNNHINGSALVSSDHPITVTFASNDLTPGNLNFVSDGSSALQSADDAFTRGTQVNYNNNLSATIGYRGSYLDISIALLPIVNKSGQAKEVNPGTDTDGQTTETLAEGIEIKGVYYTLPDADDGSIPGEGVLAINSTMQQSVVDGIALQLANGDNLPGTDAFDSSFKGLTFLLPAGTGEIRIESRTNGSSLLVKVGTNDPVKITHSDDFAEDVIPYTCAQPTFVMIYNDGSAAAPANRAPGRKLTTTTEIRVVAVQAGSCPMPVTPTPEYHKVGRLDIRDFVHDDYILIDEPSITDIDDDIFEGVVHTIAPSGRRALGATDFTFIDLSKTSIVGHTYNRETGPFAGVPENTFIYLPAGNYSDSPNVIIGGVCANMLLEGNSDKPFRASVGFAAAKVTLKNRTFAENERQPLCLPIDIITPEEYGNFFVIDAISADGVTMKKADPEDLLANKPFYFEAKQGGLDVFQATNVTVKPQSGTTPVTGLIGVYCKTEGVADGYVYNNAQKKFIRIKGSDAVLPFEAYLLAAGYGDELSVTWEGETTDGIKVLTSPEAQQGEWYTLDGRRLNGVPSQKGLYILNGKKTLVK